MKSFTRVRRIATGILLTFPARRSANYRQRRDGMSGSVTAAVFLEPRFELGIEFSVDQHE